MSRKNYFLLFSLVFLFQWVEAQDIIYLNNGTKFDATVKEINSDNIKYKNFSNPDGPTYVIAKSDVLFIEYQNGTLDIINKNPASLSPNKTEPVTPKEVIKKGPYDLYYLNRNCIYLNGIALVNSDIAVLFERDFNKNRMSLLFLGAYNFNLHANYTNRYIRVLNNSKKNYDIGVGINYYTQARKKSQYFVGLLFKYMNYSYVRETAETETIGSYTFTNIKTTNITDYQLASMLVNGVQVRVTPFFTYKLFIGLGFTNRNSDVSIAVEEDPSQKARSFAKAYLGMCVGYRFY